MTSWGHVDHKTHCPVSVVKLAVISGNRFDKEAIEENAISSTEGRKVSVTVKVTGDNLFLNVAHTVL